MSDFRFGDDYKLNFDREHQAEGWDYVYDEIDWDKVEWVEIDGCMFRKKQTCYATDKSGNAYEPSPKNYLLSAYCSECRKYLGSQDPAHVG